MGSQTSNSSSLKESKSLDLSEKKLNSFSHNYNTISTDYSSEISTTCDSRLKDHDIGSNEEEEEICIFDALKKIIILSIPAFLGVLLRRVTDTVNYMAIGRLGDNSQINGGWFALTSVNFVPVAMTVGLAGGIETLSSQAFGSGNNYLGGSQYHRGFIVTNIMLAIVSILFWNIESFLILIDQPEESAAYTAKFLRVYLPGMFAISNVELIRRFLSVQGIYSLILIMQIIAFFFHLIMLYCFTIFMKFGVYGVAYAANLSSSFLFGLIVCYITFSKNTVRENSWHWFNQNSFKGIFEYLKYALPSLVMLMAEDLCFELLVLLSGYLGTIQQNAYVLILSICATIFMISLGISITASNLVGNALGANQPRKAILYARVILYYSIALAGVISILLYVYRYEIASAYTSNEEIKSLAAQTLPLVCLFMIPDFIQGSSSGIIKAMGYQKFGAYSSLICYWVLGVPASLGTAFYLNLGAAGMRLGLYIAIFFSAI